MTSGGGRDPHPITLRPANSTRCCRPPRSKSPRAGISCSELRDHFPPGTDVTITFLPGDNYRHNVETAAVLRRAGFNPVPHIAAREMPSREALDDFLARIRGEADVTRILLIAGDVAAAKGPFKSSSRRSRQRIDRGARHRAGKCCRSSRRSPLSGGGRDREGARSLAGLGASDENPRRCRDAVLLRKRADPGLDRRTRCARHRSSRHCRSCRSGEPCHADEIRASLRHRQFDPLAAQPDRPFRPAARRYRAGRRHARPAVGARGQRRRRLPDSICFRSADCARPPTGCAPIVRKRCGKRSGRHLEPALRTRKAAPDCRPGSSCGSPRPAPIPATG